jgi:hypothetical protein
MPKRKEHLIVLFLPQLPAIVTLGKHEHLTRNRSIHTPAQGNIEMLDPSLTKAGCQGAMGLGFLSLGSVGPIGEKRLCDLGSAMFSSSFCFFVYEIGGWSCWYLC